jgi:hypothetical protein
LALVILSGPASFGSIVQYTLTLNVTAADAAPGSFASNPWFFGATPAIFIGTFDADDTVAGAISNFNMTVGGMDLALSHPGTSDNFFDPGTLELVWLQYDPSLGESAVGFGTTPFSGGAPANYAVAIENSGTGPIDPFYGFTQNWVGTFSVAPSGVPEPSMVAVFCLGAIGMMTGKYRSRANRSDVI